MLSRASFFSRNRLASIVSELLVDLLQFLKIVLRPRNSLIAENLFLRKQLAFYGEHEVKLLRLTDAARISLVLWSRWFDLKEALMIVQPETLIRWHRKGFKLFWRWKSKPGRPRRPRNIRELIAQMAKQNPTWGQARVASELSLKLGIYVSPRTVRAYWLRNQIGDAGEHLRSTGRRSSGITREPFSPVIFWSR